MRCAPKASYEDYGANELTGFEIKAGTSTEEKHEKYKDNTCHKIALPLSITASRSTAAYEPGRQDHPDFARRRGLQ
jgi:hypothetical protein